MSTKKRTRFNSSKSEEATVDNTEAKVEAPAEDLEAVAVEAIEEAEEPAVEPEAEAKDAKAPVEAELKTEEDAKSLAPAPSAEKIQAVIKSKLTTKSTEGPTDLFNPAANDAMTKADVKALADQAGFALNRGREIGARLIARSKTLP